MKSIKDAFKKLKFQGIAVSVALIVIGILFIIFPADSARIICYVAGAALIVLGVIKVIYYFATGMNTPSLAAGAALLAVGVLLCVKPDFIAEVLTVIFGIIMIIDGVVKIQQSVTLARMKVNSWWWVLIIAVITLVLGLIVTFNPFSSRNALMIFAGISLIADGVLDIITFSYCNAKAKDIRKRDDQDVIDI